MSGLRLTACRLVVRTYPPAVRAAYGDEMLGHAGRRGRRWPEAHRLRELGALVTGSLRAHGLAAAGSDASDATWRAGARLAALLLLVLAGLWNAYDLAARAVYEPLQLGAWGGLQPVPDLAGCAAGAAAARERAHPARRRGAPVRRRGCVSPRRAAVAWLLAYEVGAVGVGLQIPVHRPTGHRSGSPPGGAGCPARGPRLHRGAGAAPGPGGRRADRAGARPRRRLARRSRRSRRAARVVLGDDADVLAARSAVAGVVPARIGGCPARRSRRWPRACRSSPSSRPRPSAHRSSSTPSRSPSRLVCLTTASLVTALARRPPAARPRLTVSGARRRRPRPASR